MAGEQADGPIAPKMQRSTRDPRELQQRMREWLRSRLPEGSDPRVEISSPSTNGMSSETLLVDATWKEDSGSRNERLVARLRPDSADVPVFRTYDLSKQFEALRLVEQLTDVPVPKMWWYEGDPAPLGSPFFVMSRVDGEVPPDMMPYTFGDNWLIDSSGEDRRKLQDSSVSLLARLHSIEAAEDVFGFLRFDEPGDTPMRKHFAHTKAWYEFASADDCRSPLIEKGFEWLESHWPKNEGEPVLSWGDARIGNVMYRTYRPVAVLDWEMAGIGPRELDVAWMVFAHCVFQDLAVALGMPGMPDFMQMADVVERYEAETGVRLHDMEFYATYAALQWGIVFLRTGMRQVHFGEIALPENPDELMHHRATLERMVDGSYWD